MLMLDQRPLQVFRLVGPRISTAAESSRDS